MRVPFQAIDTRPPVARRELRIGLYRIAGVFPKTYIAWRPTGEITFHAAGLRDAAAALISIEWTLLLARARGRSNYLQGTTYVGRDRRTRDSADSRAV